MSLPESQPLEKSETYTINRTRRSNYSILLNAIVANLKSFKYMLEETDPTIFEDIYRTRVGKPPITFDVEIYDRLRDVKKASDLLMMLYQRPRPMYDLTTPPTNS